MYKLCIVTIVHKRVTKKKKQKLKYLFYHEKKQINIFNLEYL